MLIDTRCDEIRKNPLHTLPLYFQKGWLGARTLQTAYKNMRIYRRATSTLKSKLDAGLPTEEQNYIIVAEEMFLYGRLGRRIWFACLKEYLLAKLKHRQPADASSMFREIIISTEDLSETTNPGICISDLKAYQEFDRDHIWMFDAGHMGRRDFRGNPKYLFLYINEYRPDIYAYWYCEADAVGTAAQVRDLGYTCVTAGSKEAGILLPKTGVLVTENLREMNPGGLKSYKLVNLWHGIGFKRIELGRFEGNDDLAASIARKYIRYASQYFRRQVLTVTAPCYEDEFAADFNLDSSKFIRTGYLRCLYQGRYKTRPTFEHDVRGQKGLPADTRIAVYAPTYRAHRGNSFSSAFDDLESLYDTCERNGILLIFKPHPQTEAETGFQEAKKSYGERPYFLFWDNLYDFYEIIDQVDLVIYDYSSIFSDFLCAGVKHYIRYVFDEEEYMSSGITQGEEAYYERTCGVVCRTYVELLDAIAHYEEADDPKEIEAIYQKLWAYAGDDDFEKTIDAVFAFTPDEEELPTLYSFDVFDTLISRKGLHPYSIFSAVREKMQDAGGYEQDLVDRYPTIRHECEMNVREAYTKTTQVRESDKVEIQMHEIFDRMAAQHGLSKKQATQLMQWEIEKELEDVIPLTEQIDALKKLVHANEEVVLISDMYLPEKVIRQMLVKADPIFENIPLFVSSTYGVQKTSSLLYIEVCKSFKPYHFAKWFHYGDNPKADKTPAARMGINPVLVHKTEFNKFEQELIDKNDSYNAYLTAAVLARVREKYFTEFQQTEFVVDMLGAILIPYVDWTIRDARRKGFERLYFVARDGYFMKMIADAIICANGWDIETRYLYASRRTFRIPSYIDEIDDIFWIPQGGNFNDLHSKEELLKAMSIDEDTFHKLIPQIDLDGIDWTQAQPGQRLAPIIRNSTAYREYLLDAAAQKRVLSCGYLKQEFDENKKFACVEFWGRGYNQACMTRLWNHITGKEETTYYYYARSILPSEDLNVRYNITEADVNIAIIEAVFANMPYVSIEDYYEKDGTIYPMIEENPAFQSSLYDAMSTILPEMAEIYAKSGIDAPLLWDKTLCEYALRYLAENRNSAGIAETVGSLCDSMSMHGIAEEYARPYTEQDLKDFQNGIPRGRCTQSIHMSYARATEAVRKKYDEIYQIEDGEDVALGFPLKPDEVKRNAAFKKKYADTLARANKSAKYYKEACASSQVWGKICVVSTSKDFASDTLKILNEKLRTQQFAAVDWITSNRPENMDKELMQQLATARIIIVEGNVVQLMNVQIRKETTCINLLDRGFRLYHFGKTENVRLKWQYRYDSLMSRRSCNATECTSRYQGELNGFDMNIGSAQMLPGACITDVYFDENFKRESLEKVHAIAPESEGKRIVFYVPLPRKRANAGNWLEMFDMEILAKELSDEYYFLVDFRSDKALADGCGNIKNIPGFCKNVTRDKISLRNLISAADIIIGDYRDTFFECALLHKPVYSSACDLEAKQSSSVNMMYDLQAIYPFPIVKSEQELVDVLKVQTSYDYTKQREFAGKYLQYCDGKASERMLELFEERIRQVL